MTGTGTATDAAGNALHRKVRDREEAKVDVNALAQRFIELEDRIAALEEALLRAAWRAGVDFDDLRK
jgi:hypothetical protein